MQLHFDTTRQLDYVDDGSGHRRYLASFPTQDFSAVGLSRFAASSVIPRSEWFEIDLDAAMPNPIPVWDQDGHGSCVGHGSGMAFTYAWVLAGGTYQEFSPTFLYGLINGGQDNGAVVGDAQKALLGDGISLMSEVPETMIYRRQFPSSSFETAKRFRMDPSQSSLCSTFDEMMSAVMSGAGAVSFGIEIGQNFNPDSQGMVPDQRGGGGGHCMCAIGTKNVGGRSSTTWVPVGPHARLTSSTRLVGGKWYPKVKNSWSTRFGVNGICWMPESYFQGQGDHWFVRAGLPDPSDPLNPPNPKD